MKQKLSQLTAPALAGVVKAKSIRAAIAEIKNCLYDGATMIDLHLPSLDRTDVESLKKVTDSTRLPILALNYGNLRAGEDESAFEEDRVKSLLRAVEAGAMGIDMQGYTFDQKSKHCFCGKDTLSFTKRNPKEVVTDESVIARQCELIDHVHSLGAEVLLSCHPGIYMTADEVVELALFLEKRNPDIIKIVTAEADTEAQMLESFRTMVALKKEVRTPVSCHANGKMGSLTRIVNPILGGHIAFCVDRFDEFSTMGQIDLRTTAAIVENIKKII